MKKTAYLVDDEPGCLEATESTLRQIGTPCVGKANRAKKALVEIPKLKPSLVFLDLVMPGLTGLECARQLKVKVPDVKILMLTEVADPHAAYAAKLAGASAYLLKPLFADELLKAVTSSGSDQHAVVAEKKSRPSHAPIHHQQPIMPSFYVSPRLKYPADTAETYDARDFPGFVTNRLFTLWSKNETVTGFWPHLAQKNQFCVKILAHEFGIFPQAFSREWKRCFNLHTKESFKHFRANILRRNLSDGGMTYEALSAVCGYSKISHLYENPALRELLTRRGKSHH